jgi:cytochrome b6-f complex iron-sulfur subunit
MTNKKRKTLSRRDFLNFAWATSLIGLFGQSGWALFNFLKPQIKEGTFGTKVNAGKVDEFKPGTVSHIQEGRFYLSRLENGGMLAIWHRCTHLGCTVPWKDDEDRFHCPCHSSIFDTRGVVISGPAPRPLDLFPIKIVERDVIVDTGNAITRNSFDPSQAVYE